MKILVVTALVYNDFLPFNPFLEICADSPRYVLIPPRPFGGETQNTRAQIIDTFPIILPLSPQYEVASFKGSLVNCLFICECRVHFDELTLLVTYGRNFVRLHSPAIGCLGCKTAATSATAFSVISTAPSGPKVGQVTHSKAVSIKFNSKNCLTSFSGLKASKSVNCESESSFLGNENCAALSASYCRAIRKRSQRCYSYVQPHASYKVAVLGAAGGIGQPLALLIKMSPLVSALNLYENSKCQGFTGASELADCLKGADVVVIPAGVPTGRPLQHQVQRQHMPIAAEILKQRGVYDPKKLFGVATVDVAKPSVTFSDEQVQELTVRIQNAGTEVVEAKAGAGSATLSMAYAAARFVESSLRALDGDSDVYECAYVESNVTELPFFALRIKLGRKGVEAVISSELHGLTDYEIKALEALKPELKASIEKGVAFVQNQLVTA
ncbi:hypothetical protein SASPL_138622 [Salvia splendens]|uniref:malate dehydrogenase n=1 Tax=Salvia splendens TaxID=180675 RepID=A0A8X8ZE28_SALSN|nr:hypothetical protein SASPL_138622 [Salvia splendens]